MTKTFELPSGKYVAVKVPDDAKEFKISGSGHFCYKMHSVMKRGQLIDRWYPLIKVGVCEIIAPIKEITEQQAAMIVGKVTLVDVRNERRNGTGQTIRRYENYLDEQVPCSTALKSLTSLFQSLEIYSVNPYGEKPKVLTNDMFMEYGNIKKTEEWEKHQKNVGNWILLKKI